MTVGRNCLVCFSQDRQAIELALSTGASFRVVSTEYANGSISESSVGRHWRHHVQPQFRTVAELEYVEEPSDVLTRILEIADSARNARRSAEMSGNTISVTRSSDTELKALALVTDRLGVRDSTMLTHYKGMLSVLLGLAPVIRAHERVGREVIDHLKNDSDWARDLIEQWIAEGAEKESEIES